MATSSKSDHPFPGFFLEVPSLLMDSIYGRTLVDTFFILSFCPKCGFLEQFYTALQLQSRI
jgi:hypothetical protein